MKETASRIGGKPDVTERKHRVELALFLTFLFATFLSGCGGGWQQDHDTHQNQIRPGVEGSGMTSPGDGSRSHV